MYNPSRGDVVLSIAEADSIKSTTYVSQVVTIVIRVGLAVGVERGKFEENAKPFVAASTPPSSWDQN